VGTGGFPLATGGRVRGPRTDVRAHSSLADCGQALVELALVTPVLLVLTPPVDDSTNTHAECRSGDYVRVAVSSTCTPVSLLGLGGPINLTASASIRVP